MIVFSDFDGTLTSEKKGLTTRFFDIINLIEEYKSELVIVSGRSLSWGHFFLTHFPFIKSVVMEGGGVILNRDRHDEIQEDLLVSPFDVQKLQEFTRHLQDKFPHVPLSQDSYGRKTDRAIEFKQMDEVFLDDVMSFMRGEGINYSKSNVHINFWCGEISKFNGVKVFLEKYRPLVKEERCVFFGDAPNDESMFEFFQNSVGVSNIKNCLGRLSHLPKTILEGEENSHADGVYNYLHDYFKKN